MLGYILRRIVLFIPTVFFISVISFVIIQLPPGDYLTTYIATLAQQGDDISLAEIAQLEKRYGLNDPIYVQYLRWVEGIITEGDFGQSFEWQAPVSSLIWDRLGATVLISFLTLMTTWVIAIPIGVYSATHQYTLIDYVFTLFGFIGKGIPNFMLALILMWVLFSVFGWNVTGLFSPEYVNAPWSVDKFLDLLSHLVVPIIVLGTGGAADLIRVMRANTLDELNKPYVETARAQGLSETAIIWRYPVRVALNPFVSTIGYALPQLISGAVITAVVLNLQTTGPMLLRALQSQDMYLAGTFIMLLSIFTVIGTLLSDLLLAWVDPRIRLE